jgi:hypothetical protein
MKVEEILEIEKHFRKYSESDYIDYYEPKPIPVRGKYIHNEWDNFKIVIFEDNEVYQLNSDHEIQGVELEGLDDFKIRFKSFMGESMTEYLNDNDRPEKPKLDDFYDSFDPKGPSTHEYNEYVRALNNWEKNYGTI